MNTDFTKIAVGLRSDSLHSGTLDAALNLSKVFKCTLHLICFDDNCNVYEQMIKEKAAKGNVHFNIVRRTEESVKEIIKAAKEVGADLLIVPADKKTQAIINDVGIPVLSVRDDFNSRPVQHVVMPMYDKADSRQKIPVGAEIAKHFGAEVDIFAIYGRNAEEQHRVRSYAVQAKKWVEDRGVKCEVEFHEGGKVDEETIRYATNVEADLIVIMNDRDLSFFSSTLSDRIVRNSPIPVITVEPRDMGVGHAGL